MRTCRSAVGDERRRRVRAEGRGVLGREEGAVLGEDAAVGAPRRGAGRAVHAHRPQPGLPLLLRHRQAVRGRRRAAACSRGRLPPQRRAAPPSVPPRRPRRQAPPLRPPRKCQKGLVCVVTGRGVRQGDARRHEPIRHRACQRISSQEQAGPGGVWAGGVGDHRRAAGGADGHTMTVAEAVEKKRLFMLDFHDLFLPYVHKIRALEHTTMYGSRTILFLTDDGTLRLLAIELTRPASPAMPQWRQVFTPSTDTTKSWLWRMAKSHVRAHDAGHHELVTHWLRTHCAVEPYILAANRQLSEMHPVYQLLRPHFRYTMRINALARSALVNGGGIIESTFSPQRYGMELSSVAYDKLWRFDMEALPADLVRRGMAEEDPTAEHGLRFAIKDYPFANDGLLIWDAIKGWVKAYVSRYYRRDAASVTGDTELQAFWTEVRTEGHADKKGAPWWPKLDKPETLAHTLTTIIWVAAAHHAAVNFGQYDFGGYFPNRPSIARTKMPVEEPVDAATLEKFLDNPDEALRECFPSQVQATLVMAVLDVLSSHSPDEEYLGGMETAPWGDDTEVRAAYTRFNDQLKAVEGIMDERNKNRMLKNRCGAGIVPYQLMKPFSEPGVTGKGIPNSTSI
uniref:Lipoxygenase domain-containing protein n=3 Tax=Aegilops tauschii subsp. strangulata TaxID=200361 RepID=A0A453J707_AEGTS